MCHFLSCGVRGRNSCPGFKETLLFGSEKRLSPRGYVVPKQGRDSTACLWCLRKNIGVERSGNLSESWVPSPPTNVQEIRVGQRLRVKYESVLGMVNLFAENFF